MRQDNYDKIGPYHKTRQRKTRQDKTRQDKAGQDKARQDYDYDYDYDYLQWKTRLWRAMYCLVVFPFIKSASRLG